jgi:hypothetical protein
VITPPDKAAPAPPEQRRKRTKEEVLNLMGEILRGLVRFALFLWFAAISLFIFIPSYILLRTAYTADEIARAEIESLPTPTNLASAIGGIDPSAMNADQLKLYTARTDAYGKAVDAYSKYVTERAKASNRTGAYTAVVKDVLSTMVTGFVTVLLGWAFANVGAQVLNNTVLRRPGEEPKPIHIF